VQQHTVVVAHADFPELAPAPRRGVEVDLAGVLDCQHMAPLDRRDRGLAPAFDDTLRRHLGIAEEAVEPHLQRAVPLRKPPQANILARNHASDERRPLYRGGDPRTGPTSSQSVTTWRHLVQTEVP